MASERIYPVLILAEQPLPPTYSPGILQVILRNGTLSLHPTYDQYKKLRATVLSCHQLAHQVRLADIDVERKHIRKDAKREEWDNFKTQDGGRGLKRRAYREFRTFLTEHDESVRARDRIKSEHMSCLLECRSQLASAGFAPKSYFKMMRSSNHPEGTGLIIKSVVARKDASSDFIWNPEAIPFYPGTEQYPGIRPSPSVLQSYVDGSRGLEWHEFSRPMQMENMWIPGMYILLQRVTSLPNRPPPGHSVQQEYQSSSTVPPTIHEEEEAEIDEESRTRSGASPNIAARETNPEAKSQNPTTEVAHASPIHSWRRASLPSLESRFRDLGNRSSNRGFEVRNLESWHRRTVSLND